MYAVKKYAAPLKILIRAKWKNCEIKGDGQEMAVMVS